MNPLIKKQLLKVRRVDLSDIEDEIEVINIRKVDSKVSSKVELNGCYIISVEDYILKPPEGFTLHANWNNNIAPKHKFMKVDICQIVGKMVKVNSIGYEPQRGVDIPDSWSGWLPEKSIKIIERL